MIKKYWKDIYRAHRLARKEDGEVRSLMFCVALAALDKVDRLAEKNDGEIFSRMIHKRLPKVVWVHPRGKRMSERFAAAMFAEMTDDLRGAINCRCSTTPVQ